jgi:nitrate reductase gamma subunit
MLNLAQAFFAIFSLQASMFHTFGTGESWEHLMNILTGCAVCLLIVSIGIYMIRRGNREIKKLQEGNNGK